MVEKIRLKIVAQTGTALAQRCVTGHIGQLGVISIDAKPDTIR